MELSLRPLSIFPMLLILCLLFSPLLFAQDIDSQKYESSIRLDLSNFQSGTVVAHAYYKDVVYTQPSTTSPVTNPQPNIQVFDAKHAILSFSFDGQPIMDASGRIICDNLETNDLGIASCNIIYAKNPDPKANGAPLAIEKWHNDGLLVVRLLRSKDIASIKPSIASALIGTGNAPANNLFSVLLSSTQNPASLAVCLPFVIVLGLLIASMQHAGKHPLSLFDLTVPRLPAGMRVRYKPSVVPINLSMKSKMNNRLVAQAERSISTQILSLYRRQGISPSELKNQINKNFPTRTSDDSKSWIFHRLWGGAQPFNSPEKMQAAIKNLQTIVDTSGASEMQRRRAQAAISRLMQVREALLQDLAMVARGRSGGTSHPKWPAEKAIPLIEYLTPRMGRPWKFIPGVANQAWADYIPGIPFVERTFVIFDNWFRGRIGSIGLRREIYKSAARETGAALGILNRNNPKVRSKLFEAKKIGEIPRIVERLRTETYMLGRAISDEYLRVLTLSMVMVKKSAGKSKNGQELYEYVVDKQKMENVLKLIRTVRESIEKDADMGKIDKKYRLYYFNEKLAKVLADQIMQNKIQIFDPLGRALTVSEQDKLLKAAQAHTTKVRELILKDGYTDSNGKFHQLSDRTGRLPDLTGEGVEKIDPEGVFDRYSKMVDILRENTADTLGKGRIPLIMLGHDLSDILGKAVGIMLVQNNRQVSEGERLAQIRFLMEQELMKKILYDHIIQNRLQTAADIGISGATMTSAAIPGGGHETMWDTEKGKALRHPLIGDNLKLNEDWLKSVLKEADISSLRQKMDFTLRSEYGARNYLTGFFPYQTEFIEDSERNKMNYLRYEHSSLFDKGFENFFRNYDAMIRRNTMIYLALKSQIGFYNKDGQGAPAEWNADNYQKWKEKGATYGDIKKGVWAMGADGIIIPLPTGFLFDKKGNITGAKPLQIDEFGRIKYDQSVRAFTGSEYAERLINASFLFKRADGKFMPGSPTDPKTSALEHMLLSQYKSLYGLKFGDILFSDYDATPADLGDDEKRADKMVLDKGILSRTQTLENIRRLESILGDQVKLTTRASMIDNPELKGFTRGMNRATQFVERVFRGGAHEGDVRMQDWYSAQAYTRMAMETFGRDWQNMQFHSDEVAESLNAKKKIQELREDQYRILGTPESKITAKDMARLAQIRMEMPQLIVDAHSLEETARRAQINYGWADRNIKRIADSFMSYLMIAEQTVMRDPRIAYGSPYGFQPALMTGYQSGQFVCERPQMWAGYNTLPGDRIANILARPSFWAAGAYGSHTRTFFARMVGYSSIYHTDPEHGVAGNQHEQSMVEAVQSLFRPSQNFDWFTRIFVKPITRKIATKDEYGYNVKDIKQDVGVKFYNPISWKAGDTEEPADVDTLKYKMLGMGGHGAQDEIRRRKIGLSFREEFALWDKRYDGYANYEYESVKREYEKRLAQTSDQTERTMLRAQIGELTDTLHTSERNIAWKIPVVKDFVRQGYYAVSNISGYGISNKAGAHRVFEEFTGYHKNIKKVIYPGNIYTDAGGELQVYPHVYVALANPQIDPSTGKKPIENLAKSLTPEAQEFLGGRFDYSEDDYLEKSGVGKNVHLEQLRDVYRREVPLVSQFSNVDSERQMFQYHNSPYIFPLAPIYSLGYQILRKSPWGKKQSFFTTTPKEKDMGPLTAYEQQHAVSVASEMNAARSRYEQARRLDEPATNTYKCPSHGIHLSLGQPCPLCRTAETIKFEKEDIAYKNRFRRMREQAKTWALSAVSLGGSIPLANYNIYYDSVRCSTHMIPHPRGTPCPLCLEGKVREESITKDQAREYMREMKNHVKKMKQIGMDKSVDEAKRGENIAREVEARKVTEDHYHQNLLADKRMGYKESYDYMHHQMKQSKKWEKENTPEITAE